MYGHVESSKIKLYLNNKTHPCTKTIQLKKKVYFREKKMDYISYLIHACYYFMTFGQAYHYYMDKNKLGERSSYVTNKIIIIMIILI